MKAESSLLKPIEAVILWADGDNEGWLEERRKYKQDRFQVEVPGYCRNWRLFDLCLASCLKNASWLSRITLVTPGHIPSNLERIQALNPAIPIRVVPEQDFIPRKYLPLYNVPALESFLHAIPDLSDHFLLLNDDMFFVKPTVREDYFTADGKIAVASAHGAAGVRLTLLASAMNKLKRVFRNTKYFFCGFNECAGEDYWDRLTRRTARLYRKAFAVSDFSMVPHFPVIISRNDLAAVVAIFENQLEKARLSKFRNRHDICPMTMAFNYADHSGRVKRIKRNEAFFLIDSNCERVLQFLENIEKHDVVCMNDGIDDDIISPELQNLIEAFVNKKYGELERRSC